jgi:drug/metabolite transporter (DMT)-like permease
MNERLRGSAEMAAAMTISGTIGWFVLRSGQPVIDVVFWRCVFAAITMSIVCAVLGLLRRDALTGRQALLAAVGGMAIVLNWLLLFGAYGRASISVATVVYNTQPFMLVGLGMVVFKERLTLAAMIWLGIAFAGMLLLVEAGPQSGFGGADYLIGIAMSLGAAFCYAVGAITTKALTGVPRYLIVLIHVLVGTLMLAPLAHLATPPEGRVTWTLLIALGVIHTGLGFILLYGAIQKLPTSLTGALSFIYPLVAIVVDMMAFGHRLQALQFLGAGAILIAAAGMTLGWSPFKRRKAVAARAPAAE